ncbi:HNH endonuclease signature motif containing protein [Ornithinimicrobium tianjinense]|uniref:HNH endonuclease signature motif containing protein n=1 Tax=Ornithinimicrobium tianjinense TaxID=1195761 RepID=UPI0016661509|nr:HNH endonuclease signature motif containing protein [Ornithinimicrobium tianjinense]
MAALHTLTCQLDAARLRAAGELAARTAEKLLELEGVSEPGELSKTRRDRWRARAKSVTAGEVATLTGWGRGRSRELVAIALAPAPVRAAVVQGLQAAIVTWAQVEAYWRAARRLTPEGAAAVANTLLATDIEPEQAHADRLDPDGALRTTPWPAQQYHQALAQEIARHHADDPDRRRREPSAAHDARDAYGIVDDDGTGQIVITGDAASTTACLDHLASMAKRLRATGDPRTEAQLRSDVARALLLHGRIDLPSHTGARPETSGTSGTTSGSTGEGPHHAADEGPANARDPRLNEPDWDLLSPADLSRIAQVVNGTPAYHLQVIVPWDALTGRPVLRSPGVGENDTGPSVREGIGRVLGRHPLFLTGPQLRAAALAPGTTLSRILFDHADGRCIERSVARYRPDAAMREQIIAADVLSRGPGAAAPARDSQLDHVRPYGSGGATAEGNLQALDTATHHAKTAGDWDAVINGRRDVTWTTFWQRVYRTRAHDYRQYLTSGIPAQARSTDDPDGPELTPLGPGDRRHLASLLTYAALTARQRGERLEAPDDDPDSDTSYLTGPHPVIWLRHTRLRDGAKISGSHPATPSPEDIVATPASTMLDSTHWTDPFTRPEESGDPSEKGGDPSEKASDPGEKASDPSEDPASTTDPPPF